MKRKIYSFLLLCNPLAEIFQRVKYWVLNYFYSQYLIILGRRKTHPPTASRLLNPFTELISNRKFDSTFFFHYKFMIFMQGVSILSKQNIDFQIKFLGIVKNVMWLS